MINGRFLVDVMFESGNYNKGSFYLSSRSRSDIPRGKGK